MTLERERETGPDEGNRKLSYGRKRRRAVLRRSHLRERAALEEKQEGGAGLSESESARLKLLREMYD